jgi:hypothetical protein
MTGAPLDMAKAAGLSGLARGLIGPALCFMHLAKVGASPGALRGFWSSGKRRAAPDWPRAPSLAAQGAGPM